jgi:hypothetical protein
MPSRLEKADGLHLFQSSLPHAWFDDDLGFMDDRLTLELQRDVR